MPEDQDPQNPEDQPPRLPPGGKKSKKRGARTRTKKLQVWLNHPDRVNAFQEFFIETLSNLSKYSSYNPSGLEALMHIKEIVQQALRETRSGSNKWISMQSRTLRISSDGVIALIKGGAFLYEQMLLGKLNGDAALFGPDIAEAANRLGIER